MSLDESRFLQLAEETLSAIAHQVDEVLGDDIDVDYAGGILTLALEVGGQYVINKHAPNRQIWVSSPISGASHFDWKEGVWTGTRAPHQDLFQMLAAELTQKTGTEISF